VAINRAAIPSALLESELFGYEQGGRLNRAVTPRIGRFQAADRGTLFPSRHADRGCHPSESRAAALFGALLIAVQLAGAQTPPLLTVADAVSLAMKGNRQVEAASLSIDRARQDTAVTATQRHPQFQLYVLGGEALRPIQFAIPAGVLGNYPATGPIPAKTVPV
jgi:hypothetical protein